MSVITKRPNPIESVSLYEEEEIPEISVHLYKEARISGKWPSASQRELSLEMESASTLNASRTMRKQILLHHPFCGSLLCPEKINTIVFT